MLYTSYDWFIHFLGEEEHFFTKTGNPNLQTHLIDQNFIPYDRGHKDKSRDVFFVLIEWK